MFILDRNVMQVLHKNGNANVRKWFASVDDTSVYLPVIAIKEALYGWEKQRAKRPGDCELGIAAVQATVEIFGDRVLPLDRHSAAMWASLLGKFGAQNESDLCYVAVALVNDACVVTRNVKDMRHTGVRLLDPYTDPPTEY